MVPNADREDVELPGPEPSGFEGLTSYSDGDRLVIRDEGNPDAWISSDLRRKPVE